MGYPSVLFAQRAHVHQANIWLAYTAQVKLSPQWGLHLETQWRRSHWGIGPQQALFRGGLLYQKLPNVQWAVGYIVLRNDPYGAFPAKGPFPEQRIWQQMQLKTTVNKCDTWLRLRSEQRWAYQPILSGNTYVPGKAVYSNRMRIMNKWNYTLRQQEQARHVFYISAFDELILSFGKNVLYNLLDQNRIGMALGYKLSAHTQVELGYQLQSIIKSDGLHVENNHTLGLAFFTNFKAYRVNN
jgi:hypothetical protein